MPILATDLLLGLGVMFGLALVMAYLTYRDLEGFIVWLTIFSAFVVWAGLVDLWILILNMIILSIVLLNSIIKIRSQ